VTRARAAALAASLTTVVIGIIAAVLIATPRPLGTHDASGPPRVMPGRLELWLPNQTGSVKFAVVGDVGRGDERQYETAAQMAVWHDQFAFDLVLMLGDNIYAAEGSPEQYTLRFERPYKDLRQAGVSFHAAIGNHDPPGQEDYEPLGMGGRRYYTFSKWAGPPWSPRRVQFFALDTVQWNATERQWLQDELDRSKAAWKIAFYHHPLYTSGDYRWRSLLTRGTLEPLFVRGGVDVGFSGHEHMYERIRPQRNVQYFTSGAGGAIRDDALRPTSLTAAGYDDDTHFMLCEISGDTLSFQVVNRLGDTVDYGEVPNRNGTDVSEAEDPSGVN
jgi:hypothetical protein